MTTKAPSDLCLDTVLDGIAMTRCLRPRGHNGHHGGIGGVSWVDGEIPRLCQGCAGEPLAPCPRCGDMRCGQCLAWWCPTCEADPEQRRQAQENPA